MEIDKQLNGWVTYTCNDKFINGVVCLKKSLDRVRSVFDLYCMITEDVTDNAIKKLEENNIKTILVERINVNRTEGIIDRYSENSWMMFTKLNIWKLIQFNSLVYLDADLVFVQNCDELISQLSPSTGINFAAASHISGEEGIQAGLMFVRPNIDLYNDLIRSVESEEYNNTHSDQSFINWYFPKKGMWTEIHQHYNVLQKRARLGPNFENIKIYHYNGQKPWIVDGSDDKLAWKMGENLEYIFWKYVFNS